MERRDLPGNDASWYQALLAEQLPPEPTVETVPETVPAAPRDLEAPPEDDAQPDLTLPAVTDAEPVHFPREDPPEIPEPTLPDTPVPEESFPPPSDHDPDPPAPFIAPVPEFEADESPAETTSEMVGRMWTSQETSGPFDTWEPDEMDKTISSTRPFRWTSVLAGVAVVALIAVGLVLLPAITRSRADSHREMLTSALADLRAELPDTQSSLEVATDPDADAVGLSELSTQLTALTAKASAVDAASRADLPAAPPLTSSQPIDDLEPIRQRVEPLGTTAQTIQRRIANLAEYRMLMSGFLLLPDLPPTADSTTQTELRVVFASAQADSASILAELPRDISLAPHQELARDTNERFATWQVDYLEALRTEDPISAAALVAELKDALVELNGRLITPLAQIRRQTDTDLIDLARSIDEVVALAAGETAAP